LPSASLTDNLRDLFLEFRRIGWKLGNQILVFIGVTLQVIELRVRRDDKFPGACPHRKQLGPAHIDTGIKRLAVRINGARAGTLLDQRPEVISLDFLARRQVKERKEGRHHVNRTHLIMNYFARGNTRTSNNERNVQGGVVKEDSMRHLPMFA